MRIVVCVKQVPLIQALKFDKEKRTLVREGVPNEVSAFDMIGLVEAIKLRERFGGEVIAITMGPPQAKEALQDCLVVGADRAIHLTDRAFAGADTLATSRALALAIRRIGFDLVFCGRNSLDAETGQVGPEVAELLDIPHVTAVRKLEADASGTKLIVERETDDGIEVVECPLPALLTAAEALNEGAWPTREQRKQVEQRPIEVMTASELSHDTSLFGLQGSPTYVTEIQSVTPRREGIVLSGEDVSGDVARLVDFLVKRGLFQRPAPRPLARVVQKNSGDRSRKKMWVFAELSQGQVRPVTLELLSASVGIAQRLEANVGAVLVGHNGANHVETLAAYGADTVYLAEHPLLETYQTESYAQVLVSAIQRFRPEVLLLPSTAMGRDLAPRVAARLQVGLTGDCIGLEVDGEGRLVQLKPAFGGNIVAPILSKTLPQMATIRPGILDVAAPDSSRRANVEPLEVPEPLPVRTRVLSFSRTTDETARELDIADIVVSAGMGIGGPENLPVIRALARVMGASIGASRNVTDNKWLPKQHQVGLTGKSIAPRFYFAVGIRGDFNHMVGVQKAGTIIAVNNNRRAPIFRNADIGIVGDYAQVVPVLTKALEEAKSKGVGER